MKKIINLKRIMILTLFFILGHTPVYFADIYISPTENFVYITTPLFSLMFIILMMLLAIDVVCMGAGKISKSDKLVTTTKNIAENLLYYMLILLALISAVYMLTGTYAVSIIPFVVIFASIFLRLKYKNKVVSYMVIGLYLGIILLMLLPELQYRF